VRHASIALSRSRINSFSIQGGPSLAPSNLRSRGFHEIDRIGCDRRASVSVRPFLGILAERTGLIAKKGPPRLSRPSAWCRQVARYGGLRDAEIEHEELAVNPWSTPEKILTGHPSDQTADLAGNPWTARLASDHAIDISTSRTSRYGASARRSRAGLSPDFRASPTTSAIARSKTGDQGGGSKGDEFGCAPARRFDGAARSTPTAARYGFWVRFGRPGLLRLSASP